MINNELLSFIKERLAQKETKEQVTEMLVANGGWDQKDVDEAFEAIETNNGTPTPSPVVIESSVQKEEVSEVLPVAVPSEISTGEVDAEKIQFAEQTSAPILTTATTQPTPVPADFVSANPSSVDSDTPSPMDIPKINPQDISEMTVVSGIKSPAVKPIEPVVLAPAPVAPVSPIAPIAVFGGTKPQTTETEEVKIDETLQNLRTRFMQGRIVPASTPVAPSSPVNPIKATAFSSGPRDLSVHIQSGVTPSEKSINISATPITQTVTKFPSSGTPMTSSFQVGQKSFSGMPSLRQELPQEQMPPEKSSGRKLLGFFMFMTGMVFGAIAMHAYLNGLF